MFISGGPFAPCTRPCCAEPAPASGEQARQIARVDDVIGDIVCEFVNGRIGSKFHMKDLVEYVQARSTVAPDSPSRILRLQRRAGNLGYVVTNRRESEYLACPPVRPEEQPDA